MDRLRKQVKRQLSCQHCVSMTECLKGYSTQKSQLTNDIIQVQVSLYQLKETARDLRIECMGPHSGLRERARMWQRPYSHLSASIEESWDNIPGLPLVRPRKIRQKCVYPKEESPAREGAGGPSDPAAPEEQEGWDIPKVSSGCCLCKKLQEQIKQEVAELRSLQARLAEKQSEVSESLRLVQSLQQAAKQSRNSLFQTGSPMDPRLSYLSKAANSWSAGDDSGHVSVLSCDTSPHEGTQGDSVSELLAEYQALSGEIRALQERQDFVVRLICSNWN